MEIVLTSVQEGISVICDGKFSHLLTLVELPNDPSQLGTYLYNSLFPRGSLSCIAIEAHPKRILLVIEDPLLDVIPWEYLHGPNGFIVLDMEFARGLPAEHRRIADNLTDISLHIVAVPSNPISHDLGNIDIEGEWNRLKSSMDGQDTAITLERVRPPTLEQTRRLVANKRYRIVHFMGHGGGNITDAFLCFENEHGGLKRVTSQEFVRRIEDTAFLVTLNACVSATPGGTEFSNIARTLVEHGVPYALGMRHSIPDDDAKVFSRTFYDELARGSSVENSLRQARNSLADSNNPWAIGIPVLYTSLHEAGKGFKVAQGGSQVLDHQPLLELSALSHAKATFQGRVDELLELGHVLTDEPRAKLITIHGVGGQGKTVLAREAAERFAHAWSGGVWAVSLEENYILDRFTMQLARLFEIDIDDIYKQVSISFPDLSTVEYQQRVQKELERRILNILNHRRTLLVLDNAETFIEAVKQKEASAIDLAEFLREKVLGTQASLLVTSREHLGWAGEKLLELDGLLPVDGARLFWQSAPKRGVDAIGPLAQEISRKVGGHPLSLRLLGSAFDASGALLEEFVHQIENALVQAADKYKHEDHRHRTLYSSIETSVQYLNNDQKYLLNFLWVFHAGFQPEMLSRILRNLGETNPLLHDLAGVTKALQSLSEKGLLLRETTSFDGGEFFLFRTLPAIRIYIQNYLSQIYPQDDVLRQLANTYRELAQQIYAQLDSENRESYLAQNIRADAERCVAFVSDKYRAEYLYYFGWVWHRLGDRLAGLRWLEQALELSETEDPDLEIRTLNNIALIQSRMGMSVKALEILKKVLQFHRSKNDKESEALAWNNIGSVQQSLGDMEKASASYEKALELHRRAGDISGQSASLSNLGTLYQIVGEPEKAIEYFEKSLQVGNKANDYTGDAITLNNIGNTHALTGQPRKALEYFDQALEIQKRFGDLAGQAVTLNNMALVFQDIGQLEKALEILYKVIDLRRATNDRNGEATTLNNIAMLYINLGKLEDSFQLLENALLIVKETKDKAINATVLNNLALIHQIQEQPEKALEIYEQALSLRKQVGDRSGEASTLSNIGLIYKGLGDLDKAFEIYGNSLAISQETGDLLGQVTTLNNLARLNKDTGKLGQSLEMYKKALEISRAIENPAGEAAVLTNMSVLLYMELSRQHDGIVALEQAVILMRKNHIPQIESGNLQQLEKLLEAMKENQ